MCVLWVSLSVCTGKEWRRESLDAQGGLHSTNRIHLFAYQRKEERPQNKRIEEDGKWLEFQQKGGKNWQVFLKITLDRFPPLKASS